MSTASIGVERFRRIGLVVVYSASLGLLSAFSPSFKIFSKDFHLLKSLTHYQTIPGLNDPEEQAL